MGGHTNSPEGQYYFVKIWLKEGDRPVFKIEKSMGKNNPPKAVGDYDTLEDMIITNARWEESEYEGAKTYTTRLWMKEPVSGDIYIMPVKMTRVGRSLINRLLTQTEFNAITMKLYTSEDEETKKVYNNMSVKRLGDRLPYKYDNNALKELVDSFTIPNQSRTFYDTTKLDKLFEKEVKENLAPCLELYSKTGVADLPVLDTPKVAEPEQKKELPPEDDLPF